VFVEPALGKHECTFEQVLCIFVCSSVVHTDALALQSEDLALVLVADS